MSERLRVGISCYPTYGGSGIVATELGLGLARLGHEVHFICSDAPRRFPHDERNVFLHEVRPPPYPLFGGDNQYALALTSRMVEASRDAGLDILHVHYAIPHAVAGVLARQILGARAPKLVTTLHGTDITVVGGDPSFLPVTRFSIEQSDAVTVPSRSLRQSTFEMLLAGGASALQPIEIEVIPNFVDTEVYSPAAASPGAEQRGGLPRVVHNSNFRPLKRVLDVVRIFARAQKARRCELHLIGDGPDRPAAERLAVELGVADSVRFLGEQREVVPLLRGALAFLLPSESESFGLAALEAMSCGVPVVASNTGGLPEVVDEGKTGFLADVGDLETMSARLETLLTDDALQSRMAHAARAAALERFQVGPAIARYLACYRKALAR